MTIMGTFNIFIIIITTKVKLLYKSLEASLIMGSKLKFC